IHAGGGSWGRADLSAGDEHSGSRPGARPGTGGALLPTLGNRDRPGRTENALAWIQNRPAQQDARPGTPGILRTDDDAFCHPGTHARSGPPRSRRSDLKTHLRGSKIVLRSKTPDLVRQEFYGLMMTHFAIRGLMHEAALQDREDPDRRPLGRGRRVVRRKLPRFVAIPPSGEKSVS